MAPTAPMMIDINATAIMICCHTNICEPNASSTMRMVNAIAATLSALAKNAVTGVGAPSYTSGVHMWNGAALILKARPERMKTMPKIKPRPTSLSMAAPIAAKLVDPAKPYTKDAPNKSMPLASAPRTKYFSPASAERPSERTKLART